jgi:hypothetical protein
MDPTIVGGEAGGRSPGFILGHNPSDPKLRIVSRGYGAVERAACFHFPFNALHRAGPDHGAAFIPAKSRSWFAPFALDGSGPS